MDFLDRAAVAISSLERTVRGMAADSQVDDRATEIDELKPGKLGLTLYPDDPSQDGLAPAETAE